MTTTTSNLASIDASGVLRIERLMPASIERVWAYLAEPDRRAAWLAGGTMAREPGGRIELQFDHVKLSGERAPERFKGCNERVLAVSHLIRSDPPNSLTMSWDDGGPAESEVSFELVARGPQATLLSVTHRRLPGRAQLLSHATGWHTHLDALEDVLSDRPARPFWTNFQAHEAVYAQRLPS